MSVTISVLIIDDTDPTRTSELRLTRPTRERAAMDMHSILVRLSNLADLLSSHNITPILDNPSTTQLPSYELKTSPAKGKTT